MAQQYSRTHTLTSDNVTVSIGFRPSYIRIECSTANTAYLNFGGATASTLTTADQFALTTGSAVLELRYPVQGGSSQFGAIASTGSTGTIKVLALR